MQGGKNRFLPKYISTNRFFWDSHWPEIWSNHFCPSMGPNGGSVATDSGQGLHTYGCSIFLHGSTVHLKIVPSENYLFVSLQCVPHGCVYLG
jgi:hypothetical protein